jgi:HEAT repeat protein
MEIIMRWVFPLVWFFIFSHFGTSLAADESSGTQQSARDLIKQLSDRNPDTVCAAARGLGNHGQAKEAAPALKELLKNPNGRVKWTAAEALWRLEHKATDLVPVYAELLTATDADVRAASAWRLGRLGSAARPAVTVLAAALRDENLEVRIQVGQALGNLGALAKPALPALLRALGDERLDEPGTGAQGWESARRSPALPALVELADDAIPLLIATFREGTPRMLRDNSSGPIWWVIAARVVHAFPAFGERAVGPLVQALSSKDKATRSHAARALGEMAQFHGLPEKAIEKLERCLDDPDKDVGRAAAGALSWVRPASTKAVTILENDREAFLDDDLLGNLERMSPHNPAARKLLFRMLGDDNAKTAQEAHRILAELELPAEQVLSAWTRALSHADSKVRQQALFALWKLGPSARSAKSTLYKRFPKETDHYRKGEILDALTAVDPDDPALVPLLIKSMDDSDSSDSWVRYRAINCFKELGPKAKDALPRIEARLFSSEEKDKGDLWYSSEMKCLVDALVRIAPGSSKIAATLLKALRRRDIRAVHEAKNSWYMRDVLEDHLQANLPAAAPLLREALKDKDVAVRRSAALVLVRAGQEIETALPVLMENLWSGTDRFGEQARFRRRVVELLSRRRSPAAPAVAAAWCKAWQTASPEAREVLEPGLLVLQREALPHLLDQLRKAKKLKIRRDLAHLLAHFEGQSKKILPILREELREPQPASQYMAAQALMMLGPDAAEAVPELLKLLNHKNAGMRALAAQVLGSIGRTARLAVPALKAMLKEAKPQMRIVAANALSRIAPDVSEALALLRDELRRQKQEVDFVSDSAGIDLPEGLKDQGIHLDSVEESILRYGERAASVLADVLDDVDLDEWSADNVSAQCGSYARIRAALLLARLGPEAKAAVPALVRALKDKDPFIRDAAASALGRIGSAAKEAAPDFISLLEQQNRLASAAGTWSSSLRVVGRSGATNGFDYRGPFDFRSAGREHLLSRGFGYGYYFNRDPYRHVRPAYPYDPAYVLSRIDSEARSALPILREMARDPNHPGRLSAALAIWRGGDVSPNLVPALAAALETNAKNATSQSAPLSREIRECLAELDTELKPALGVMGEWLKQRQSSAAETDQVAVIEALGRLGADARAQADLLRPMLQADRWYARRRVAAALALFRILEDRNLVLPVLREVLLGLEEHGSLYYRPDMASSARVRAARALGVLAEKGDERAKSLIVETAKGDENPHVRVAALEALARLKETNPAAIRGLCAVLRHHDADVRIAAASACGRLGPRAKSSAKALRVASEDGDPAVRQAARQALEALD